MASQPPLFLPSGQSVLGGGAETLYLFVFPYFQTENRFALFLEMLLSALRFPGFPCCALSSFLNACPYRKTAAHFCATCVRADAPSISKPGSRGSCRQRR
ncbi:hypothetical protein C6558_03185 [Ensifer sp. NM-2]|nr:hypothetical protein [Ensifer canadensis]PSS67035.1 hypothetical protein C6558_03185 [Ensifer sp. NM-2]